TGTFVTKNAGTHVPLASIDFDPYLTGSDSGNYTIEPPSGLRADINKVHLRADITGTPAKTYDGGNSLTLTDADYTLYVVDGKGNYKLDENDNKITLQDLIPGEGISIPQSATASYDNKNVGTGKHVGSTLKVSDFLAQGDTLLTNYVLPKAGSGDEGRINAAIINLHGQRVYDGARKAD